MLQLNFIGEFVKMIFPDFNPVLLEIGPFSIKWYGVAYVLGILGSFFYISKINESKQIFSKKALDDLIFYYVIGVVFGGRLGFVLFYHLPYFPEIYVNDPFEIFKIWHGGMSFHGGMLGVILASFALSKKYEINFWKIMDLVASIAPLGLLFGRIANFINGELVGRKTDFAYGMIFPRIDQFPRHASQIYEAFFEGLVLLLITQFCVFKLNLLQKKGALSGVFLSFYGLFRFLIEFTREADVQIGLFWNVLSMGQMLCLPMIILGLSLIYWKKSYDNV